MKVPKFIWQNELGNIRIDAVCIKPLERAIKYQLGLAQDIFAARPYQYERHLNAQNELETLASLLKR